MTVREIRMRFDELLVRLGKKPILGFKVDHSTLLWAITYKASGMEIEQVEDMILGSLIGSHTFCSLDPCMPSYPEEYSADEILRWETIGNRDEDPVLSEFLAQRIGTYATYTLVAAIALYSTRDCGKVAICFTSRTNLVKPNHAWLRMEDGRVIDLYSRSLGEKTLPDLKHDREIVLQ